MRENSSDTDRSNRDDEPTAGSTSRRGWLKLLGAGTALLAGSGASQAASSSQETSRGRVWPGESVQQRLNDELRVRTQNARYQLKETADTAPHESNDRLREEFVIGKFGKGLAHHESTGLPTPAAYDSLVRACEAGSGYDEIMQPTITSSGDGVVPTDAVDGQPEPRPLVQPESAWTYLSDGGSSAQLRIATPPAFDSAEAGAEMVELYWRALTRDVNFRDYEDNDLVRLATIELNILDAYNGPGAGSRVTPGNVFRGVTPGATTGPYVSQFLWKDRNLGGGVEDQKIQPQIAETTPADYLTTVEEWLKVQKGVSPAVDERLPGNEYAEQKRHIVTGRDMCERVHDDPPFRQLQKAAQVLVFSMNAPLDEGIPFTLKPSTGSSRSQRNLDNFAAQTTLPFNDFGPLYVEKAVIEGTEHGQLAAWHKKWNVHRRLRPEEFGGRVEAVCGDELTAPDSLGSAIPDNLLGSLALAMTRARYDTCLLPQAYAEGSPTHPSYPAGHSVVAGAGVTVLKALFDGDYEFPTDQKVVPTRDGSELLTAAETDAMGVDETLTVRGELNKLASNMALGRNRAGIHYRTDGIEGLRLGEAAAIRYLENKLTLPKGINDEIALSLETFDGDSLTIQPQPSGRPAPLDRP